MSDFTAIPLSISFSPHTGLEREKGGIEECIDRLLELIVFTPKGSFSADPEFGFEYWNHEFSNLDVREFNNSYLDLMGAARRPGGITRRKCEASLRDTIAAYEPRLRAPEVKVELDVNTRDVRHHLRRHRRRSRHHPRLRKAHSLHGRTHRPQSILKSGYNHPATD